MKDKLTYLEIYLHICKQECNFVHILLHPKDAKKSAQFISQCNNEDQNLYKFVKNNCTLKSITTKTERSTIEFNKRRRVQDRDSYRP